MRIFMRIAPAWLAHAARNPRRQHLLGMIAMARPRKHPAEQRLARLPTSRVTLAELAQVEDRAFCAGISAAEFVRRAALGRQIGQRRSRVDDALLVELNRIGVNINQMARATNSGRPPLAVELRAALAELRSALETLLRSEMEAEPACGQIDADGGEDAA